MYSASLIQEKTRDTEMGGLYITGENTPFRHTARYAVLTANNAMRGKSLEQGSQLKQLYAYIPVKVLPCHSMHV